MLVLAARLFLCAVFGVAGFAKLTDRSGSRQALIDFGIPVVVVAPLVFLLPLAELAVALSLLLTASAWYGAVAALSLLLLFTVVIAFNLARGRTPNCHCFGQLSSAPAGRGTLIRNALLTTVAGFLVWYGSNNAGLSVARGFEDPTTLQNVFLIIGLVAVGLLFAEGWVLLQILHQHGRFLLRLEAIEASLTRSDAAFTPPEDQIMGLPIGASAPSFRLKNIRGEMFTLEHLLLGGKPILLFFTNPNCGPCQALMPEINRWQREYASNLSIVLISEGKLKDNNANGFRKNSNHVLLQRKREVAEAYEAYGTPSAILVRPDGRIGSPLAPGADAIRSLVMRTLDIKTPTASAFLNRPKIGENGGQPKTAQPIVRIGEIAPALELRDLTGRTIKLTSYHGRETLLLFWNPNCGFCQKMLDDLKDWEDHQSPTAPELLMISNGSLEENLAMNLRSTVVLDADSQIGAMFNANGTPMAVLLDANGRIASEVAAGAEAVLALAGVKPKETIQYR
jgi:thiol-disulfide isomerase/thioredoxin/uncharacterized membrane protein YphA (DoxX/SURF4 family)